MGEDRSRGRAMGSVAAKPVPRRAIDLSSCDREPIHVIGSIQPHGALIAVHRDTFTIDYVSRNAAAFLGLGETVVLGTPLQAILGEANCRDLATRGVEPLTPDLMKPWFLEIRIDGTARRLECLPHRQGDHIILEFVEPEDGPARVWEEDLLRQRIISELIRPDRLEDLARVAAEILRDVTGFDRVMIYRFAQDKHGEVIAESTVRPDSFLGMHYPASDIPEPARRHFLLNVIRTIPDIHAAPVPVLMRGGDVADASSTAPLDLTYSKLRAVAPVHIEYLENMGVGGSMSISLTSNDRLWGLVACHHYGPHHLPWSCFRFCELLGGTVSALLQSIENAVHLKQSIRAERTAFDIESDVRGGRRLGDVIASHADALLLHAGATGLILRIDGTERRFGRTIDLPPLTALWRTAEEGVAFTNALTDIVAMDDEQARLGAGAALLELSDGGEDFALFLREEFEQTIKWAGKPDKIETRDDKGVLRLSPRGSFALWSEERRGRSKPFADSDREALRIIRRALFAMNSLARERAAVAAQKEAEAEEARLRLMVLEAGRRGSMGELASALAHELNQPLAAVSNYVNASRQELRNFGIEIPVDVSQLMERAVAESSRASELVRRLRNFIAQGELVAERIDLAAVVRQGADLALASTNGPLPDIDIFAPSDLPAIWADPLQIGQVALNLSRNAIQAMSDSRTRRLTIRVTRRDAFVEVSFRDTGRGLDRESIPRLFDPFHNSTTSGMGIGLSLCRTIVEAHSGRIWAVAYPDGAEFVFSLKVARGEDGRS